MGRDADAEMGRDADAEMGREADADQDAAATLQQGGICVSGDVLESWSRLRLGDAAADADLATLQQGGRVLKKRVLKKNEGNVGTEKEQERERATGRDADADADADARAHVATLKQDGRALKTKITRRGNVGTEKEREMGRDGDGDGDAMKHDADADSIADAQRVTLERHSKALRLKKIDTPLGSSSLSLSHTHIHTCKTGSRKGSGGKFGGKMKCGWQLGAPRDGWGSCRIGAGSRPASASTW